MSTAQKIVLAGGSGFIGQALARYFSEYNYDVVILSRSLRSPGSHGRFVHWDGKTLGPWVAELDNSSLLINLSGRSVDCRYTALNRQLILDSRIDSTRVLGEAIQTLRHLPGLWINLASATIYRHAEDRPMDEITGEIANDFSVQVCKRWEQTFFDAEVPATVRKVALRTSMVMGRSGGVFPVLERLTRLGLGGKQGNGNQFVSWIHELDFCRIIQFVIDHPAITGVYNATAPTPIPNKAFMQALRSQSGFSVGLPATRWMLEFGAFALRTETELVLKSRWVLPTKLQQAGFQFAYNTWLEALQALLTPSEKPQLVA